MGVGKWEEEFMQPLSREVKVRYVGLVSVLI